ncbi:DNA polymerase III subunit gamma/tau [Candidatus Marinamargulisbacteria bacterium SCGC AG-410-N11]|nr:DNA polymerase III subunit gamma/tau [Candidatus Marinamargulisbacteria bacterium SCGC AG-410-N11]
MLTMTHTTFYRKYRSQSFNEMQGQQHVIQTIQNAVKFDRLAHAYIFSGPRGTGKTSTARILAKMLNVTPDHTIENCPICIKISKSLCVDVIEIDAASNTGVDNIRDLNEKIHYSPIECKYKIYIIDEAHMLSSGAFNALLKTMEEPPKFTLFILATTEPHKIPITIHSRCQHLQFKNISQEDIIKQLQMIADNEKLSIDTDSLSIIARNSSGCMRDAISLLDQAYSFKGNTITKDDVVFMLGSSLDHQLYKLIQNIFLKKETLVIQQLEEYFANGINVTQLIIDTTRVLRQMLLIKCNLKNRVTLDENTIEKLSIITNKITLNDIHLFISTLADIDSELRWFSDPELLIQIKLLTFINKHKKSNEVIPITHQTPQVQNQPQTTQKTPITQQTQKVINPPHKNTAPSNKVTQNSIPAQKIAVEQTTPKSNQSATPDNLKNCWLTVIDKVKKEHHALYAILRNSNIIGSDNETIYIQLKQDFKFFREKLNESNYKEFINKELSALLNKPMTFSLDLPTKNPNNNITENKSSTTPKQSITVNQIIEMFDGTII